MALTKSQTVIHNDITLTAGAGDTTSTNQDLSSAYSASLRVRLTNGATGPTVPAQTKVQVSEDTTAANFITIATITGLTSNSGVMERVIQIPSEAKYVRLVSGSNTGQNVTLRAVIDLITAY